ncbi:hypothetical protein KKE06_02755 [Candidatus Micrarchaeota archaeon]|nr:hypothetical protein [Candidatus Micrarchaeota archaeon]MBU1930880.1 hypothetical protein [Candidatus Micrarchaeota archaeon]
MKRTKTKTIQWKPIAPIIIGLIIVILSFLTDCAEKCGGYNHLPHQIGIVLGVLLSIIGIYRLHKSIGLGILGFCIIVSTILLECPVCPPYKQIPAYTGVLMGAILILVGIYWFFKPKK